MGVLVVSGLFFALILLKLVLFKIPQLRARKITKKVTLNRVANVGLAVVLVWAVGWLFGRFGSANFRWPHITLDDLAKLGPAATAATAFLALVGVGVTVWQKNASDARDAWWKRTEWALDWTYGEDSKDPARKTVGLAALKYQQHSRLAKPEEAGFLVACVGATTDKVGQAVTVSRTEQGPDVRLALKPETPSDIAGLDQEAGEGRD